jgi:hypothetical protein
MERMATSTQYDKSAIGVILTLCFALTVIAAIVVDATRGK